MRSTYFTFQKEFYEHVEGVAMGSPLSPIVANLYMEKFKKEAIEPFPLKPKRWKRYVDDHHVVWPHGEDNLAKFLEHINKQNNRIRFTMELETNNSLPFLDVLISMKEDGSIAHQVFRKKTHTEKYLHANSHHFPSQNFGIISTLATRAHRISDIDHIDQELEHLHQVFKMDGYDSK